MSDSISMIADEIMRQVLYGATVDWRPNMAQIAQRLRELDSLRQVPERWSARYFASGPQGEFFTPSHEFAEAIMAGMRYDRDDWTITDLSIGDTCNHAPPTSSQGNVQPESLTSGAAKESEATHAQAVAELPGDWFGDMLASTGVVTSFYSSDELPPLPKPLRRVEVLEYDGAVMVHVPRETGESYYTADQMRAYAELARRGGSDAVLVPRDVLLTEARRLRYRAGETLPMVCESPATDAGAQMIHTAETLERYAND